MPDEVQPGAEAPANDKPQSSAASARPAPEAEPSDVDLLKIITENQTPATSAGDEGDDDDNSADQDESPDADDDNEDGEDEQGDGESDDESENAEEAAAEGEESAESEEGEESEGEEPDGKAEDPDKALDDESKKIRAKFTPEQQKLFDKAVSKKTARIIALRTENETFRKTEASLRTELAEAKANPPAPLAPTKDNPLADVDDDSALEKRLADAKAIRAWVRRNPQGGIIKAGEEEREISAETAVEMLENAEEVINEHVPARREFLQRRAESDRAAETIYPWLKDKNSVGSTEMNAMLRQYPALRAIPAHDLKLALADMLYGKAVRNGRAAAAKANGGKPAANGGKPAPKAIATPKPGARPPKIAAGTKVTKGAVKRLVSTGEDPGDAALRDILRT